MKNTITWFLAVTAISLGVVCVVQYRKSAAERSQLASAHGELAAQSQQVEDLQAAQERAERQRRELKGKAEELAAQLAARQFAATNTTAPAPINALAVAESDKPDAEKGGFGKMLSAMMQDPDTRKLIREQQRMMMDQMYAPLVKKMGLTPEEATQFKEMLADNMMNAADKASSVFGGLGSTNRTEMLSQLTDEQKTFDDQVKALLGDTRYAQYKDYQETVGDRTLLNQFKQQAGSDYNLTDPQTEALLTIMNEERKRVSASSGLPLGDTSKDPAKFQEMMSDEKVAQMLQSQETVNQRVYERARTILSSDQLSTLSQFQNNQMQMMRMGMTMARKMFAPDKPAAGAAPGN